MIVLGVDPGVAETGWAVLEAGDSRAPRLVSSGVLRTGPSEPLPARLRLIHEGLRRVLADHRPSALAVEEMFFLKAAHTVRAALQARGVVLLAAGQAGTPVAEYNPRQVKSALTGSGSASKTQMQRMVARALGLEAALRPDDVSDAAAIALCHLRASRYRRAAVLGRIGGSGTHGGSRPRRPSASPRAI